MDVRSAAAAFGGTEKSWRRTMDSKDLWMLKAHSDELGTLGKRSAPPWLTERRSPRSMHRPRPTATSNHVLDSLSRRMDCFVQGLALRKIE